MKLYINTQAELDKISVKDRHEYYFHDDLVATAKGADNGEPLVEVIESEVNFWVRPFWLDLTTKVSDPELQELLDKEGLAFKEYMRSNPNFKMSIRSGVLEKLIRVQDSLPDNLKLVLKAGYRPLVVQKVLFEQSLEIFRKKYPKKTAKELYELNLEFVADPDNYIPPHSTGGAVDILLFDMNDSKELDMGSPINYPDDKSWTYQDSTLTREQIENRDFLTKTMLKAGFANLASEWWHYSYGDQYWAKFYNCNYLYAKNGVSLG